MLVGTSSHMQIDTAFLVSYVEDDKLPVMKAIIRAVKEKFKGKGIKLFCVKAEKGL